MRNRALNSKPQTVLGLLSEPEAARLLGVGKATLKRRRLGKAKHLPECGPIAYVKLGRVIRYEVDELRRVINACRKVPAETKDKTETVVPSIQ